jgi:hypothetical protein
MEQATEAASQLYEGAQSRAAAAATQVTEAAKTVVSYTPAAQLYEYLDPTYFDRTSPNKGYIARAFDSAAAAIAAAGDTPRAMLVNGAKNSWWTQAKMQPIVQDQPDALLTIARRAADQFRCRAEFDIEWAKIDPAKSLWPDLPDAPNVGPIVVAAVAVAAILAVVVVVTSKSTPDATSSR